MNNSTPPQALKVENLEKENLSYVGSACIQSEHAVKYLNVLCRHFARKVEAEWDDFQGVVYFDVGITKMKVNIERAELYIECKARDENALNQQKAIINHHIALFARREAIELVWF